MKKIQKNLYLDKSTASLIECISIEEGISESEIIRLLVRAWQMSKVVNARFPGLSTWSKSKLSATLVKKELEEVRSCVDK